MNRSADHNWSVAANKVLAFLHFFWPLGNFLATRQLLWSPATFLVTAEQHFWMSYWSIKRPQKFVFWLSSLSEWEQMRKRRKAERGMSWEKGKMWWKTYRHIRSGQVPPCWTAATCRQGWPRLCLEVIFECRSQVVRFKWSYQGYVLEGSAPGLHGLWSTHSRRGLFQK